MAEENDKLDNPKWVFDDFRERVTNYRIANEMSPASFKGLLDDMLNENHVDIDKIRYSSLAEGFETPDIALKILHPLIMAVTKEAIEIMKIFGSDYAYSKVSPEIQQRIAEMEHIKVNGNPIQSYWGEYELYQKQALKEAGRTMEKVMAVTIVRTIKEHAFVEFLHREGQISDADYQTINAGITAGLDALGINGLEKLLQARPDLEELLRSNQEEIEIFDPKRSTSEVRKYKKVKRGEYYTKELAEIEASSASPDKKQEQINGLREKAMGKQYIAATNNKYNEIRTIWSDSLNLTNQEFLAEISKRFDESRTLMDYMTNNYIGSKDPRLAEKFKESGTNPDDIYTLARLIATDGKYKNPDYYKAAYPNGINFFGKNPSLDDKTQGLLEGDNSQKKVLVGASQSRIRRTRLRLRQGSRGDQEGIQATRKQVTQ